MIVRTERPEMTPLRATVLHVLSRYCVLGYDLTLLEVQKLLYFLQEAGEPLRLRFREDVYGPYADNLRHVLHLFEGHFISGFGDGKNSPSTVINLLSDALDEAERVLSCDSGFSDESKNRIKSVVELIEGFESPYGMELLATVHWVVAQRKVSGTFQSVVEAVHSWNERKRHMMKPEHIRMAWERLKDCGWIEQDI